MHCRAGCFRQSGEPLHWNTSVAACFFHCCTGCFLSAFRRPLFTAVCMYVYMHCWGAGAGAVLLHWYRLTVQKKKLLVMVERERHQQMRFGESGGNSWLPSMISSLGLNILFGGASDRLAKDSYTLQEEIRAVEELSRQLFLELVDMRAARDRELESRTWRGRVMHLFGHLLVCVCVFRIGAAGFTLAFDRKRVDPITRLIHLTVYWGNPAEFDEQFWSQFTSFILVGVIVFSSIRSVLIRLMQFFSVRCTIAAICRTSRAEIVSVLTALCRAKQYLSTSFVQNAGTFELHINVNSSAASCPSDGHVFLVVCAVDAHEFAATLPVRCRSILYIES